MFLEDEIILLRAIEPTDADIIYQWENNIDVWKVSNMINPISLQEIKFYIDNRKDIYIDKSLRLMIMNKTTNKAIGTIDFFDFDIQHQRVGIGILIADESDRKKSFANSALKLCLHYAFNVLFLNQIFCHISEKNTSSIKLFEKNGFEKAGKLKAWQQVEKGVFETVFFYQKLNH